MGIRKRLVWLVAGLVLCQMCGACGKETSGEVQPESTAIVVDDMLLQDETPAPTVQGSPKVTAGQEQAVTPVPAQKQATVTEAPGETVMVTEVPRESVVATETPRESIKVTETPREPVVKVTEEPGEQVKVTAPPRGSGVVTEPPQESVAVTEPPREPVVATVVPLEHVHSTQVELEEATCLNTGVRKEYCTSCNEVLRTEKINAPGHDFTKSVWELPTCQKSGYYNNVCNRCGLVECVTQEPLPHEVEDITLQEGNCMEDTVIQHVCKICGVQVKEDTRYTRSDLHTWQTESIDGEAIVYCEWCGVTQ